MGAADGVYADFGEASVAHLPRVDEFSDRAGDFLDWNFRVDTVLVRSILSICSRRSEPSTVARIVSGWLLW